MTTKLDIEKVRKATEVLPERFYSRQFWLKDGDNTCYCFWGWVAIQLGADPLTTEPWSFLAKEIGGVEYESDYNRLFSTGLACQADRVVDSYGGDPKAVREQMLKLLEAEANA